MKIYFKRLTPQGNYIYYIITYNINEENLIKNCDIFIVKEEYIFHNNENKTINLDIIRNIDLKDLSYENKISFIDERFSEVMNNYNFEKISNQDEISKIEELFNILINEKILIESLKVNGIFYNAYKNVFN